MSELIARADQHATRTAFRNASSSFTYGQLLKRSGAIAGALLDHRNDLEEERIAFQMPAGIAYADTQWGIWRAGGISVALNQGATAPEIEHILRTAGVRRVLVESAPPDALAAAAEAAGASCIPISKWRTLEARALPLPAPSRRAMIVFTSGTTSKPKGVVWTHAMLAAQISAMVSAWEWQEDDCIPLFLPLHHVHGMVNVMCCALWSGACIEAFEGFRLEEVLARVLARAYSVFMAVPTIYVRLIQALEALPLGERIKYRDAFGAMRLMVSGSAALPASVHKRWQQLTGQLLLERYGMTEIGMALSNPVRGERRPGSVGLPMPGVDVRLSTEQGETIEREDEPGELWVRGPGVFCEYWDNPGASAAAFTNGWFRTGDVAVRERGYYRIMGRQSVDIIKSGGYKISALEIESTLLDHPAIRECAVLGREDPAWGEIIAVAAVLHEGRQLDLATLQAWCEGKLSSYKIPRLLKVLDTLPRNAMGKVIKPELQAKLG